MKIKFNIEEAIQKEYILDLVDTEIVIRRAEEIKARDTYTGVHLPINFYYECAIQQLLSEDTIYATLISEESEDNITSVWIHNEEDS